MATPSLRLTLLIAIASSPPVRNWRRRVRCAAAAALTRESITGRVEISLVIADDDQIRELNSRYRKVNEPTDVLAFPQGLSTSPDGVLRLGDIVVSWPTALAQAREYGHPLLEELELLVVHGVLHLLGYRDSTEDEKQVMRAKETQALAAARSETAL